MKFFKKKETKKKVERYLGGTAILGGAGAIALSTATNPAEAKVYNIQSYHPTDEINDAVKSEILNPAINKNFRNKIRKGDVVISNSSDNFNKLKTNKNTIYVAADQGNAPTDINNYIKQHPNQRLGWGTNTSEKAEYIFGSKGIKGNPNQKIIETLGLPSDSIPVPNTKVPTNSTKKQIGLSYGNASQSGTIFGIDNPLHSEYTYTPENIALQPRSRLDIQPFNKILEGLDKHYGKDNYELEVFTGTDKNVHDLLNKQNYSNVKLTELVPKQEFINKVFSKDLMFTNPGLNLVSLAKSDYKIPTILLNTKEKAAHNANYDENIKWFTNQQENAKALYMQDIAENSDNLSNAIKDVTSKSTKGKAMLFDGEKIKKLVNDLREAENIRRKSNIINRLLYTKTPKTAIVGAAGLLAGIPLFIKNQK